MPHLAVIIFITTYLGVAIGRIPGQWLDRTGIALLDNDITTRNIPSLIMETMAHQGITITNLFALTGISTIMSNLVSNVPAAMLLVRFLDPGLPEQWYVLALSSTFAGNLIIIGSIANLIVIEQARKFHIEISFREHARAGIPITLFSLLVLILLLYLRHLSMPLLG